MKKDNNIPNFKVPEDYFETFEEQLFSKISEEKFPKTNGFAVPHNYFESVEERVLNAVNSSEKATKVHYFRKNILVMLLRLLLVW